MENNWYCNKCHNENFKVTMSNSNCPICGSSDIERISYEKPEKLYTKKEIVKLYWQYIKECRKEIPYEGVSYSETFENYLEDK